MPSPRVQRGTASALAIFGVWTTLGLLSCAQAAVFLAQIGQHLSWGGFGARMVDWYTCGVFTPPFFWMAARFPVDRWHWRTNLFAQLAGSTVAVVLKYAILARISQYILFDRPMTFQRALASNFIIESMIFWAVIAIIHGILFYRRWQEREQLAVELRGRLTEAQLEVLKGQLRPHFLFNTLNSISTLVHSNPASADRMVVQLADLLRASLETSGKHEIPLGEELALLERYIDIMRVRHEDRLSVAIRVTPRARGALVPHFILQPLVENAIEHGIARRAGAGRIMIDAADVDDALQLRIGDDGCGIDRTTNGGLAPDEGVGLGNTRLRLRQLYGDAHSFAIRRSEDGGALVAISIPLRIQTADARA
ncbi:MAG TPA: sensor histidine kinase [Gemmatimonadaceae bacterium]|nr:sensor histidine kinase [Gemmatimonadaceae bacterium]